MTHGLAHGAPHCQAVSPVSPLASWRPQHRRGGRSPPSSGTATTAARRARCGPRAESRLGQSADLLDQRHERHGIVSLAFEPSLSSSAPSEAMSSSRKLATIRLPTNSRRRSRRKFSPRILATNCATWGKVFIQWRWDRELVRARPLTCQLLAAADDAIREAGTKDRRQPTTLDLVEQRRPLVDPTEKPGSYQMRPLRRRNRITPAPTSLPAPGRGCGRSRRHGRSPDRLSAR